MILKRQLRLLPLVLICTVVLTDEAHPTRLVHRNLKGLVQISKRIFVGTCVSVREGVQEFENGGTLYYTEYTFEVSERIKGDVVETITFRQLGLRQPRQIDERRAAFLRVPGMPVYQVNKEYMLFLIGDSRLGLTSPVGLFQGAFSISRDRYGSKVVTNGVFNRGLFKDIDPGELEALNLSSTEKKLCAQKKGPFELTDFGTVVKKFIRDTQ